MWIQTSPKLHIEGEDDMVCPHLFDRNTARMVDNQSAETGPHLEHMLTVLMVMLGERSVVRVISTPLTA